MSKKFGFVSLVASFVFACSFLAVMPAQADIRLADGTEAESWNLASSMTFLRNADGGWEQLAALHVENFLKLGGAADSWNGNNESTISLNPNFSWSSIPENQIAVKIEAFKGGEAVSMTEILSNLIVRTTVDGEESVAYNGPDDAPGLPGPVPGQTDAPEEYNYYYGLEEVLAVNGRVGFFVNSEVLSNYDRYVVTVYAENAPGDIAPEPATLAVLGLGLLGTGLAASRRRNKK